ncbi:hypothetical protein COV93_06230 [Candidatus Woesearchaeota archaeon CG11_big_fil_rev_8_21_14_0_20_43_8]|nr:MAG: hypothetical protein COV93_06230 [Candidatus Woesearchaeota archaeon CG11_big_fil_rev_8_21_14_0_20_43_8]PIO05508.1 MAG: hypothetical protein COT47_04495 [Candidatus Woesearchaeota archaeon CG08_land_8_20_14_0_20_43_7]
MERTIIEHIYGPMKIRKKEYFMARRLSGHGSPIGYFRHDCNSLLEQKYGVPCRFRSYSEIERSSFYSLLKEENLDGLIGHLIEIERDCLGHVKPI